MNVVLLHAYSSTNSGDDLLVREALTLIREIADPVEIKVLALDPTSFDHLAAANTEFIHPLTGDSATPGPLKLLTAGALAAARGYRLPRSTQALIDAADLIVGVGGGYMRGASLIESLRLRMAHLPQLAATDRSGVKSVYLPQSIGPLRWGTRNVVTRHGGNIIWHARDDRSMRLMERRAAVRRTPDSAILPMAAQGTQLSNGAPSRSMTFGLVARQLHSRRSREARYESSLVALALRLQGEPLLQASARGNDDSIFYRRVLGEAATRSLVDGTHNPERRVSVVVSVRLHGAIQSVRNGVPAIHLSYERKGWGAYQDLGLTEYVHDAFSFDPDTVCRQAIELARDPERYWQNIAESTPALLRAREALLTDLIPPAIPER